MSFHEFKLDPLLVRNLASMGYQSPRPIQLRAIPTVLEGADVIGLAQTGTGKTAAFAVPVAHRLLADRPPQVKGHRRMAPARRLRSLVLCPTRELARQVAAEIEAIVRGTVLRVACVYGKVGMQAQAQQIARGVDLLVGTPGRVRELVDAGALSLHSVRVVTIDEADRMMDLGFLPQVTWILHRMETRPQTLLFTATMPPPVETLARRFLDQPQRIEIGRHTTTVDHIQQHLVAVHDRDKVPLLLALIAGGHGRGMLVFCRTKRRVGWVGKALMRHGLDVGMIHGDRTQAQRMRALERFVAQDLQIVVGTDVAARGLHIPTVRTVVNYDLPIAPEEYVHRIGRAGHGGGFGESFTFLTNLDRDAWNLIERTVDIQLQPETIEGFEPRAPAPVVKAPARRAGRKGSLQQSDDREQPRSRQRRSRRSRPISKDEKPGGGVKRPNPDS